MTSWVEALYIILCIPTQNFQNIADLHFAVGSTVKIDNRGKATILRIKSSTVGEIHSVLIDGIDFKVDLSSERLSIVSYSDHDEKQTCDCNKFLTTMFPH